MSEIERTPLAQRTVNNLEMAIAPEWQKFAEYAEDAAVQDFCVFESSYNDTRLSMEDPLSLFRFTPVAEHFGADAAAELLNTAYDRTDNFMRGLMEAYCARKRQAVPDISDVDEVCATLGNIFRGGLATVEQYMRLSGQLDDETLHLDHQLQADRIGITIPMIAARLKASEFYTQGDDASIETDTPQAEIDAAIDEVLQQACAKVMQGEKHIVPKDASQIDQLFAQSMNILRTLYTRGQDPAIQKQLFNSSLIKWLAVEVDEKDYPNDHAYGIAVQHVTYEAFKEFATEFIGMKFSKNLTIFQLNRMFVQRDEWRRRQSDEEEKEQLWELIIKTSHTHSARRFVHGVVDGSIRYSEVMRAMMQLKKAPLAALERKTPELAEEILEWDILPADVFGPREREYAQPNGERKSTPLDMSRIERLYDLAKDWKGAYIAHGVRTGSGNGASIKDDHYYVLVLPEELKTPLEDGTTIIEHAIADSPRSGRGLYVFRAEQGLGYNPRLTWREVFSQRRGEPVKKLGALCLPHKEWLEDNLFDILTCQPEEIERRRRYLLGRRALYLARKKAAASSGDE